MSKINVKNFDKDFEVYVTIVTAEDIMYEVDYTEEDIVSSYGRMYDNFVRAMLTGGNYGMRLFAPIKRNNVGDAINEVMQELLTDYNAFLHSRFHK